MIGCQVVVGQEVCTQNSVLYISNNEVEIKVCFTNLDGAIDSAETVDIGAVGSPQLDARGALKTLLSSRGY